MKTPSAEVTMLMIMSLRISAASPTAIMCGPPASATGRGGPSGPAISPQCERLSAIARSTEAASRSLNGMFCGGLTGSARISSSRWSRER